MSIYRRGKAPQGAEQIRGDSSDEEEDNVMLVEKPVAQPTPLYSIINVGDAAAAGDRRLRRLMNNRHDDDGADVEQDRNVRLTSVASSAPQEVPRGSHEAEEDPDADEAQVYERRRKLREQAAMREQLEEQHLAIGQREEEDEEESEYETDSEEEAPRAAMLKPVFIPKSHRDTVLDSEKAKIAEARAEEERLQEIERRKIESRELVEEQLRRELAEASVAEAAPDVDDTDGVDEEEEYELWKLRELKRIKRDKEEQDAYERELEQIERRRNMTDAEIMEEDEKIKPREEKGKYKFLQKYYHKGAFFADDDSGVLSRDFNQPTLEDKFDKSILPAVMQVKRFGRSGQTKWTHLSNEDTSARDSAWFQDTDVNKRMVSKLGGMAPRQPLKRPSESGRDGGKKPKIT